MVRGISLHVGINQAGPNFPGAAALIGAENDAREMDGIAQAKGFAPHDLLLGPEATYENVTAKIHAAAATLETGDIFLFTFAGHGFQLPDQEDDETGDFEDEVLVLFDRHLLDDEIRKLLLPCFKPGVRFLGVVDACHSESVFTAPIGGLDNSVPGPPIMPVEELSSSPRIRRLSPVAGRRHFREHRHFYKDPVLPLVSDPIHATILLLAACLAHQTTGDGPNGVYTSAMLKVLRDFDPPNYDDLVDKIKEELSNTSPPQTPTIEALGQDHPTFRTEKPFSI